MDSDLAMMSPEQLIAEVKRLRQAIREHRDASGHNLCWYHPEMWGLLPESANVTPSVPEWPQFMQGCARYRASLDTQAPQLPRTQEPPPDFCFKK